MPVTLDTTLQALKFLVKKDEKETLQKLFEDTLFNKLNHCTTKSMEILILQTLTLVISELNLDQAIEWFN
jgi:hypothetical protein